MPSSDLWMETDIGFGEDITTSVLLSDKLQRELCTKLLWHFIPMYLTVNGTSYEQDFIKLGMAIYAAHWPEDTTYGIKPMCQRTCLSKCLVPPEEVDTTDWDLNSMPELFYRNNNLKYQQMHTKYSDSEARQMWAALTKSIHAFLKKGHNASVSIYQVIWFTSLALESFSLWCCPLMDDTVFRQIVWEYPERPDKDNNETPDVDLPVPWEPW
ncbi:hypothetical protein GYMLUDRAFT_239506 [Collybiopsis luxurians FD-317 M1]|nr:hypothetical protein GYMLUDRAFT_239506 [Collybiopsis luxurians FD-317 M1]